MSYILSLIGARFGSRGGPDKNIRDVAGHPLLAYSIRAALHSPSIDRVIVSTDSPEYGEIAKKYGAQVPFIQPPDTARDNDGDYPFIAHAIEWLARHEGKLPNLIVHLRPTTPLREISVIEAAIARINGNGNCTALRSVHEMSESAYKCFEIDGEFLKCVRSGSFVLETANKPRQQYPITYQANGYVDVLRTDYIRSYQCIHGNRVQAFLTAPVIEVDTEADFALLKYEAKRQPEIIRKLFGE